MAAYIEGPNLVATSYLYYAWCVGSVSRFNQSKFRIQLEGRPELCLCISLSVLPVLS